MTMIRKRPYVRYRKFRVDPKGTIQISLQNSFFYQLLGGLLVQHSRICLSCRGPPRPRSVPFLACPYQSTDCCGGMKVMHFSQTQDSSVGSFQLQSPLDGQLRLLLDMQHRFTSPSAHPTPQELSPSSLLNKYPVR